MKILYGILFVVYVGQNIYAANETVVEHIICKTCDCNVDEKRLQCGDMNLIKVFDENAWKTVSAGNNSNALSNVDFSSNGIEVVTKFPTLEIRTLNFTNNKIRKIDFKAFQNLTKLEKLDLSENRLTKESLTKEVFEGPYNPTTYEPLNVKWLSLANNELHALDYDVFDHLPYLETLYLCHNTFKVIDDSTSNAISTLSYLQTLDLSSLELRDLPEFLLHSPSRKLRTLNLSDNLFQKIPDAIQYSKNLIDLNLDDNPIEQIGGSHNSFPALPKLETLSISFMHNLKSINEGAFQNLSALRHFNCQHNTRLVFIHPQAFGDVDNSTHEWPPIQDFVLFRNNLSTISEKLLHRWDEIEDLDIRFNPWSCTCENQWMIDKLVPLIKDKNKNTLVYVDDIKCDHPESMAGKSFSELSLKNEKMRCEDYYGRRPERDGPILVGIFIGLMIGIPLTMFALWVYRRGCFGLFGYRPSPADYGRAFYKRTELREDLHM